VLVELGPGTFAREAVEIGEQVELARLAGFLMLTRLTHQVVDEHLGMNFFLDVERRCLDHQIRPVFLVLAPPDELRVKVAVAALVSHPNGALFFLEHHRLVFGSGDVLA